LDDDNGLFVVVVVVEGEIVISDSSSIGFDKCLCSDKFVDERREMSLSVVVLHTW